MKIIAIPALAFALGGCAGSAAFFGSNDPCTVGAGIHASFVTVVGPRVSATARQGERALYAGFVSACNSGDVTKPNLRQLLDAYTAAVEDYKKG